MRIVESRADLDRSVCRKYQDPTGTVRILVSLDFYFALLYPKQLRFILIACLITLQLRQLLIATLAPLV